MNTIDLDTQNASAKKLLEILEQKYCILNIILDLTRKQSGAMSRDSIDNLQNLIDQKQKRIDEVNRIDEEFNHYFGKLKAELGISRLDELKGLDYNAAKGLRESTGKVLKVIGEISEIEKGNSIAANKLFDEIKTDIRRLSEGRRVSFAYKPVLTNTVSYFIDKKK